MSENDSLFVGLEVGSGEEVNVPIFHTLTTGQTQLSGKTTVEKKLARLLAEKDFKIVVFDTKENLQDYEGFGQEIPVCLRESTDPLVLLPLLESIFQRRLPTGYYSVLAELSGGTKSFAEVISRAKDMEKTSRSGWKQGVCRTLYDLLERLQNQLSRIETVPQLELPYEINRMVLNEFPQASQQLFIKNAFEDILHVHNRKTIPMLDECHKFLPQRWGSACARPIQDAITQLAITKSYVYLATQYLAPTDKNPLKACAVRLLGTQDHKTEAMHTLDLIPFRGVATEEDVMRLPLGHFYVTTKKWVKLTYFLAEGVPKEIGVEVALRKRSSEWVRDTYLKPSQVLGDEEMYEQLNKRVGELERKLDEALRQEIDVDSIASLVLPKIPVPQQPQIDKEALISEVMARLPKMEGVAVYQVAPLKQLQRECLEQARNQILGLVKTLDEEQIKILRFSESIQRETNMSEVMEKGLFLRSAGGGSRTRIQKKIADMISKELLSRNGQQTLKPNLNQLVTKLLQPHNGTAEEIESLYDHIIYGLLELKKE